MSMSALREADNCSLTLGGSHRRAEEVLCSSFMFDGRFGSEPRTLFEQV